MPNLILASASRYKQQQLSTLQLAFETFAADINEVPNISEPPKNCALRLAISKAEKVATLYPDSVVIGCDQTAGLSNIHLQKPLTQQKAFEQLQLCSGKTATFYSAVAIACKPLNLSKTAVTETKVTFRTLSTEEIRSYIEKEDALDCAGGFKVESLGISLFDQVESKDPSALIGLPLIALNKLLMECGIHSLKS